VGDSRDLSLGVDGGMETVTRDGMEEVLAESLQAVSHRGGWGWVGRSPASDGRRWERRTAASPSLRESMGLDQSVLELTN
jgi:hypothetical protein